MTKVSAAQYDDTYYLRQDVAMFESGHRALFFRDRISNIERLASANSGDRVLDIGCGMGTIALQWARRQCTTVGLDYSFDGVRIGASLAARHHISSCNFVAGDAAIMPFRSGSFDMAISADLVEHITRDVVSGMLHESFRVLKRGGNLAIYTPCRSHLFEKLKRHNIILQNNPLHINVMVMKQLVPLVEEAGFKVRAAYHAPSFLPIIRCLEMIMARLPVVGGLFRRRICIVAEKPA